MSWLFTSGDQSIGVSASASVLPMNIQGLFSLGYVLCQFYLDKIGKKWEISPEEINISLLSLSLAGCCGAGRHVGRILSRAKWPCCSYTPTEGDPRALSQRWSEWLPMGNDIGLSEKDLLTHNLHSLPALALSLNMASDELFSLSESQIPPSYNMYCKYFFCSFSLIHSLSLFFGNRFYFSLRVSF